MPACGDDLQKIFEPFYTQRRKAGGTGLGLFIVKQLVETRGGSIEVKSKLSEGSTFTVLWSIGTLKV